MSFKKTLFFGSLAAAALELTSCSIQFEPAKPVKETTAPIVTDRSYKQEMAQIVTEECPKGNPTIKSNQSKFMLTLKGERVADFICVLKTESEVNISDGPVNLVKYPNLSELNSSIVTPDRIKFKGETDSSKKISVNRE